MAKERDEPQGYDGVDRRRGLSEADIERIAEIAAQKALDKVYVDVGKGVLKRAAWVLGAGIIALLMWLGKNHVTFNP
jgi:hypothetical protein